MSNIRTRIGAPSMWSVLVTSVLLLSTASCGPSGGNPKVPAGARSSGGLHATIETDKGAIEIEFLSDAAPTAVENFRLLAEHHYYDGLTFHRVVKGFMIQGGDPAGDGTGGQSAWGRPFADEIDPSSALYQGGYRRGLIALYQGGYRRGLIAMANRGANTNGSQFFILHQDYRLPPAYVIFARVTAGMETVDELADTATRLGMDGEMSQPLTPPVIKTITVRP